MEQHRLTPGPLLNQDGDLAEAGYAFGLVKTYDRSAVKAGKSRIKEWDYYYVGNASFGVALTVADNGYMSMASISVLDLEGKKETTVSRIGLFPMGKLHMPASSKQGDVVFLGKDFEMRFLHEGDKRRLLCKMENFGKKGVLFRCDILLEETNPASMVIATPFKAKKHFYYNQKINNQKASGYAKVGERMYEFLEGSYAVLYWGRGVWTYKNTWYWSSLNAEQDGVPFGFNLGYGFGDTSKASENMLFVGEEAYKLDDVIMDIPFSKSGGYDFLKPWTFRSREGNLFLTFTPILDRHADLNLLFLRSNQHQVFGTFSGEITVEGKTFTLRELPGFAEKVFNKW